MIKRNNLNKQMITIVLLGLLLLYSPTWISATITWEETFPNENIGSYIDRDFFSYEGYSTYGDPFEPNYTIVDGALAAPYQADWDNTTWVIHNSTLAYGTWSFDL